MTQFLIVSDTIRERIETRVIDQRYVEVEKRLSLLQRIRMTLGDIALAALALWLAAIAIRRNFR
ncbi:MAG: hypothetical protein K2F64_01140 [Muribaculaceae bacterium]|nr:hypothetical protein [Muribaculaceae bacterium]